MSTWWLSLKILWAGLNFSKKLLSIEIDESSDNFWILIFSLFPTSFECFMDWCYSVVSLFLFLMETLFLHELSRTF